VCPARRLVKPICAALDGVGVLYTALDLVASLIEAGRLVPLLEDWQAPSGALFPYYPSRRQVPAPLQAFIEFPAGESAVAEA
jgi:DNA-binding transcriptional LysR family regulator